MEETAENLKNLSSQMSGNLSKTVTNIDVAIKKCTTKIQEQGTQLQADIKSQEISHQNTVRGLHMTDSELFDKIRTIEQRLEAQQQRIKEQKGGKK